MDKTYKEIIIKSKDTERDVRVPPGQHLTQGFPVLQHGPVQKVDRDSWRFKISGLVKKERTLNLSEFTNLPMVKVFSDIHCVTSWSKLDNLWEGVSSSVLKDLVEMLPEAKYAMIYGVAGFSTNLSLNDLFEPDVLFALRHNNEQISDAHGAPVRLVVPRLYFWKSAKWVTGVEFMKHDKPGFWESAGYHNHGDPWTEERYGR